MEKITNKSSIYNTNKRGAIPSISARLISARGSCQDQSTSRADYNPIYHEQPMINTHVDYNRIIKEENKNVR